MAGSSRDIVILDGRSLTPAAVTAVARGGAEVRLDDAARARNAAAARALADLLERGEPVYGVTTGVGGFRTREVPPDERPAHQLRLLRSHACGAGRLLSPDLVRAAMVVRANQLGAGGAGVSDELLVALVDALNAGFVPVVHELGSLGTGDLTVLAEIALALLGEGRAWRGDTPVDAGSALADARLAGWPLGPRDGIAIMSSSAATIGHAALVAAYADRLLGASLRVAALSFIAAAADPAVLDARVQAARAHPGQVAVAARVRELLGAEPAAATSRDSEAPIHDPYPFRALPQVDGATLDALSALEAVLAVELNSASENALIDPAAPAALPTANFHTGSLALALDRLRAALAQSCSLGAARVSALLDPGLMGLPAALSARPGPSSGAMILEYTAHAAAADVRVLAAPVATQTATVGGGVESHASFAPFAARLAQEALDSATVAIATELVVAVRALRMCELAPSGTQAGELFAGAAARLDADLSDRALNEDVEAARRLLFEEDGAPAG
jgi:histidine ammonia-lyase